MKTQRFDEYHKHGCHFDGKLVVVNYYEDMTKDPKWGTFNADLTYKYMGLAARLVKEKYGEPKRVLLGMPDYVVEVE
jgi:hypothetical protein